MSYVEKELDPSLSLLAQITWKKIFHTCKFFNS